MHNIKDLNGIYFEGDLRVSNIITATQLGLSISNACADKAIKDSNRNVKELISFFKSKNVNLK